MFRKTSLCIALVLMAAFSQTASKIEDSARLSPRLLNYQGYVTDTLGNPLNDTLDLIFRIFSVSSGGTAIWTELQMETAIIKGIFNTVLGNVTPIPDSVFTKGTNRWLELRVGGQTMSPRTQITASGYAFTATYSDTAEYARVAPGTDSCRISANSHKLQGKDTTDFDARYVNEGQAAGGVLSGAYPNPALADNAVTTPKILDTAVTMAKIAHAGAASGQVIKWNGTAWQPDVDFAGSDMDWIYLISDSADTTLQMGGRWGLARPGNVLYGSADSTHVNLGVACTTGVSGQNYKNCVVGGGFQNSAKNSAALVAGGENNTASGWHATVGGGFNNVANYSAATIAGGESNTASAWHAFVGAGYSNTVSANADNAFLGGGAHNTLGGAYTVIGGGYYNNASGYAATVGGGFSDTVKAYCGGVISGYSNLAGDAAPDTCAVTCGGYNNSALAKYSFVGGGYDNLAGNKFCTVVGGDSNTATSQNNATICGGHRNYVDGPNAFVGGGRENYVAGSNAAVCGGYADTILAAQSFIGGGSYNSTNGECAAIAGGSFNYAGCNGVGSLYQAIGGGYSNWAKAYAGGVFSGYSNVAGDTTLDTCAVVCGGYDNVALTKYSFVGGGYADTANGIYASVPGGSGNNAAGNYSFAAGRRAKANNQGCFVWGDATDANVSAGVDNRWVARCSGGVYFYTNAGLTTGAYLAAGSGTWASVSDRNMKENFQPVDGSDVLAKLMAVPITTWNYKSQDPSIRHIGPMAQDFAGFGVGEDDKSITTIDADGVALAAIQELNKKLEKLEAENQKLRQRIEMLENK